MDLKINFKSLNGRTLKILNWCMHILMWVPCILTAVFWRWIPEQVAQHFNSAGEIDTIGKKSTLILILTINALIYGMHFLIMYITPSIVDESNLFSERIRHKVSREEMQNGLIIMLKLVGYMDVFIMLAILYTMWHTIKYTPIGKLFIPVFLCGLIIDFFYFMWKYIKFHKAAMNKYLRKH
jgi:hypothetical protein